ncbi:hypothetical protein M413DRAFT_430051 [Hebeloma cylindrosporum]|uniref:Mediator of RNA polymerase II transcription subunit 9 n=1 Tax=Hebeloma cylindrosporum TaxID=76867 RepID=A0A0C3C9F5_HEBCY|nr:hypothetical protein M413DRAFT_430051 [Hebeloma cylindrosporum h7]
MSESATVLPVSLYEGILPKLVAVLQLTQDPAGVSNPQARQKLLQATNNFKNAIAQAKDFAINLPGGELLIEEQDDIIQMLETLRDRKRAQLAQFAAKKVTSTAAAHNFKMEVDSVASTPYGSDD